MYAPEYPDQMRDIDEPAILRHLRHRASAA